MKNVDRTSVQMLLSHCFFHLLHLIIGKKNDFFSFTIEISKFYATIDKKLCTLGLLRKYPTERANEPPRDQIDL